MMIPGQAMLCCVGQHAAQHAAKRVTRQQVVSDMIGRHSQSCRVQMPPMEPAAMPVVRFVPLVCYPAGGPRSAALLPLAEIPQHPAQERLGADATSTNEDDD